MTGQQRNRILHELNDAIVSLVDGVDWQMTYNRLHHKPILGKSRFTAEQAKNSMAKAKGCARRAIDIMRRTGDFGDSYDFIMEAIEDDDMYGNVDNCYSLIETIGLLLECILTEFA